MSKVFFEFRRHFPTEYLLSLLHLVFHCLINNLSNVNIFWAISFKTYPPLKIFPLVSSLLDKIAFYCEWEGKSDVEYIANRKPFNLEPADYSFCLNFLASPIYTMNHVLGPQAWTKYDQLMPIINFFDKFLSKKQLRVWFNNNRFWRKLYCNGTRY